jgi:hypothetical protein
VTVWRLALFFLCLPSVSFAGASAVLTPRFEAIQGKETMAKRALLRAKLSGDGGPYSFYVEGFGEAESDPVRVDQRRLASGVFLQEAYVEFKLESFYLRAGKQSMRWSEMWVVPSLDVWTARRWNRFLFDPQPEQLEHSGGVSASYAVEGFSVDVAAINEPARARFPDPLPEFTDEVSEEISGGFRVKGDVLGFGLALVSARVGMKDTTGIALNRAFESFVPKFEAGTIRDRSLVPLGQVDDKFVALGVDIFLGNWTLQPQATAFDFGEEDPSDYQSVYYLGANWLSDRHDLQMQTFGNTASKDFFFNLFYGFNWKDWVQVGGFVQNYQGSDGRLFTYYHEATGGWLAGLRLELNTGLNTD